jgi:alpha-tubulin suppressor-like RCC1 family protein
MALGIVAVAACGRIDFDPGTDPTACRIALDPLILGLDSTIGVGADGSYYGMGANTGYPLSITGMNYDVPTPLPALAGFQHVTLGVQMGTAIAPDGTLRDWGAGAVGIDQTSAATDWHGLQTAWSWACATHSDASLWCWGDNYQGNLGDGTMNDSSIPLRIAIPPVASFSVGNYIACAIDTSGVLWCWGQNDHGQTANGACCTATMTPTQIGTDTDWQQVSIGGPAVCARKTNDTLWCWGNGYYNGTVGDLHVPTLVGTRTDWIDVQVGFSLACATAADRTVWCFGDNTHGQLGLGTTSIPYEVAPTQVPLPGPVDSIQLGGEDACARISGQLWCWGHNATGALGNGTFDNVLSPTTRCPM